MSWDFSRPKKMIFCTKPYTIDVDHRRIRFVAVKNTYRKQVRVKRRRFWRHPHDNVTLVPAGGFMCVTFSPDLILKGRNVLYYVTVFDYIYPLTEPACIYNYFAFRVIRGRDMFFVRCCSKAQPMKMGRASHLCLRRRDYRAPSGCQALQHDYTIADICT